MIIASSRRGHVRAGMPLHCRNDAVITTFEINIPQGKNVIVRRSARFEPVWPQRLMFPLVSDAIAKLPAVDTATQQNAFGDST